MYAIRSYYDFHNNFEIEDMIRIYNPKINPEMLKGIQKKYLEQIK